MNEEDESDGGITILEAYIFSYLMEKAWEISSTGEEGSVLYIKPTNLDQKLNLFLGCGPEIQELENIYLEIRR